MSVALLILGAVGHVILWVAAVNRIHALGIARRWVDLLTVACVIMFVALPPLVVAAMVQRIAPRVTAMIELASGAAWFYIVLCAFACIAAAVQRWLWYRQDEQCGALAANHTTEVCVDRTSASLTAPGVPTWLSHVPGNQVLELCVQEKHLLIPRLSREHEGLRIVHVTDLHMSGRITRPYFEQVVDAVNECRAELVAITGDIVERYKCLEWIPETLGRLRAPGGVYFVLGNHDRHVNEARLKAMLTNHGMIYLGSTWREVTIRDAPVILAGNEVPWYPPAADLTNCPAHDEAGLPLRILLTHSPDQFEWAQANEIDLMLAGHLHGGQVRLPVFGAFVSPSMYGVRYASGVFAAGNTVLHVSRGIGSLTPLRLNCRPEIAVLELYSGRKRD